MPQLPGRPFNRLGNLLRNGGGMSLTPSPERSALIAQLLQQSAQPQGSQSALESLNIAAKPILAALLSRREQRAGENQARSDQEIVSALLSGNTDPQALSELLSGNTSPFAQSVRAQIASNALTPPKPQTAFRPLTEDEKISRGIPKESFAQINLQTGEVDIDDPPGSLVDVTIDQREGFGALSNSLQNRVIELQTMAASSRKLAEEMSIMQDLASSADTGLLTPVTLPIKQGFEAIGVTLDTDVPLLEAMRSQQNQLALRMRNPDSGFGLTGSTSDKDLRFLRDAVPGLANTPEGNVAIATIMQAKSRRDADLAELEADYISEHKGFTGWNEFRKKWINDNSFFTADEQAFIESLSNPAAALPGYEDLSPAEQAELQELERRSRASTIRP